MPMQYAMIPKAEKMTFLLLIFAKYMDCGNMLEPPH